MGLFGGKDKGKKTKSHRKGGGDGESRRTQRKSRRIAAPTDSGGTSAVNQRRTSRKIEVPTAKKEATSSKPLDLQSGEDDIIDNSSLAEPGITESPDEILLDSSANQKSSGIIGTAPEVEDDSISRSGDQPLLDFLINKVSMINDEQAEQMRQRAESQDVAIDVVGVKMELYTEDELVNALTQECWVPHLKVDKYDIRKKALDTISSADAKKFSVLPVDKLGGILNLAMVNPLDNEAIRVLESKTGLDIKKVVATRSEIDQGIAKYYGGEVEISNESMQISQDLAPQRVTQMISKAESAAADDLIAPEIDDVLDAEEIPDIGDIADIDDIEDIDDLLAAEDNVQPAIIESISVDEDEIDDIDDIDELVEPAITSHDEEISLDDADLELVDNSVEVDSSPVLEAINEPIIEDLAEPAIADIGPELDFDDDDDGLTDTEDHTATDQIDIGDEELEPSIEPAAAVPDISVPELEDDFDLEPSVAEVEPAPEPALDLEPDLAPAPAPTPSTAPVAAAAKEERPGSMLKKDPATSRFKAANKKGAKKEVVELTEVLEEEFQHAITHSKSHVFEKWSALQTRNRILNAVTIPDEMGDLLSSLEQAETIKADVA